MFKKIYFVLLKKDTNSRSAGTNFNIIAKEASFQSGILERKEDVLFCWRVKQEKAILHFQLMILTRKHIKNNC